MDTAPHACPESLLKRDIGATGLMFDAQVDVKRTRFVRQTMSIPTVNVVQIKLCYSMKNSVLVHHLNSKGTGPQPGPLRRPAAVGRGLNVVTVDTTPEPRAHTVKRRSQTQFRATPGAAPLQKSTELALTPLASCLQAWLQIGVHPWVLSTISKGYKLQFARRPPACGEVLFSQASGPAAKVLRDEITSLLVKRAIRVVPPVQSNNGFYSRYFLVKKKGGGMRPILDLRALNRFLKVYRFKMLTSKALLRMMRRGDWYTTLDLRDAYFHIPVYPPHRKFLRFGFEGQVYEYLVLPFGLSLSPRTFVKCSQAAVAPLRQRGVRIAMYVDDWLIYADSESTL